MDIDILIYVEDPGAANYVAGLPAALEARGWRTRLLAEGIAREYLANRGIPPGFDLESISAEGLLSEVKPKLLITGTSENVETLAFELTAKARAHGIPTLGVIDAYGNAAFRFRGKGHDPLGFAPEWLAVPDRMTREAYVELGFAPDRIALCGHPHYDYVLKKARELAEVDRNSLRQIFFGAQAGAPVVLFASEISTGLDPAQFMKSEGYTLTGRGTCQGRTEIVIEEFLDGVHESGKSAYLVLRLHPKSSEKDFSAYWSEFNQVSRSEPPLDLIYAADLVVGMSSMFLMEASLLGRKTLSIVPRAMEKRTLPSVRAGVTPSVSTRAELRRILPGLIEFDESPWGTLPDFIVPGALQKTVSLVESLMTGSGAGRPPL